MENIKVDKYQLLNTLKANKEQHVKDYNDALAIYKLKLIEVLTQKLKAAKAGNDINFNFPERPVSYEESYDTIITKLKWTTQDEIELDDREVKQYIQNEWQWKHQFAMATGSYIGK